MGIRNYKLEPPKDWQEFERLCHGLWTEILKDPNTLMHGRQGQKQAGVDIYGNHAGSKQFYGIQCKGKDTNYGRQVTEVELREEVTKALTFSPQHPQVFILATTAPRDVNIQRIARNITLELKFTHKMKVVVYSWEDICERIGSYSSVIEEFYPHHSPINKELIYGMGQIKDELFDLKKSLNIISEVSSKLYDRAQVERYFVNSSNALLAWPRTLSSNSVWIDRPEEQEVTLKFDASLRSSSIILGEPGTGKSALLSKIAQALIDDGELVLAIKADQLDHSVCDFRTLGIALGLPGPVDECLKIASNFGSVFLVVDQLDTLSELVDVKTNRLSVLLNLILGMSLEPNVHILASSRPFEFNYDIRLSSIKADQVQLQILKWETVGQILVNSSIHIKDTDDGFRSFLQRPSNLNFYLSYLKNNPQKYFQSHIELYEDIWKTSLGTGDDRLRRSVFLLEIASIMTSDAKQSLPIIRYDEYLNDIDWLVGTGILVKNNSSKSFSFAHQTLQAFVWTRSFIKQNISLKDFIIEHQNNLNVRPKLSTTLFYLREADSDEYNSQITDILSTDIASIRRHIVHLVIECIGMHHDPNTVEIKLLKSLVEDDYYKGRVGNSVAGKDLWFDNFRGDIVPKLMSGDSSSKYVATSILSSVLPSKADQVFSLIDQYWKNSESTNYILHVLRRSCVWNGKMLEQARYLITCQDLNGNAVSALYYFAKEKSPEIALQITASFFLNKLKRLLDTPFPEAPPLQEDATEIEKYEHWSRYNPKRQFHDLFDFGTGWHDLCEVAQIAPVTFIEEFWSFFLQVCEYTKYDDYWEMNSYKGCSGISFHLSDDDKDLRDNDFCEALEAAVKLYARDSKDKFWELYIAAQDSDILPVQRMLMKGLCEIAKENQLSVLGELIKDKRRLKLGNTVFDHYSGTKEVITVLCEYLSPPELNVLEDYLLAYNSKENTSERSAEGRKADLSYNRRIRYQLLSAVNIDRRSDRLKKILAEEERAFGKIEKSSGVVRILKAVGSPMNKEQLQKANDDEIINCFREFSDGFDKKRSGSDGYVSGLELGRAFEQFAEENPERATKLIKELNATNVSTIGYGLVGLARSNMPLSEFLDLITCLLTEFACSEFYEDAARAIRSKIVFDSPLSQEWLDRIESWLLVEPVLNLTSDYVEDDTDEEKEKRKIESILWEHNKTYIQPGGNYQILQCLTEGYLHRNEPLSFKWSNVIISYANRKDSVNIWLTFLVFLFPKAVGVCNASEIERILDTIIKTYPVIISRKEIAFALAEGVKKADDDKFFEWLNCFIKENTSQSIQIYGELLGIKWIINPDSVRARSSIDTLINKNNTHALCGLAFTLKNIWKYRKSQITDLYVRLINLQDKTLSTVLLGLLRINDLEPSSDLNKIIDAFNAKGTLRQADSPDSFILHRILPLTAEEPLRVAQICDDMIIAYGSKFGDVSTSAAASAPDLITIAITIHNLGQSYQNVGLDLFEKLMDLDVYQIQEALRKIDLTPQVETIKA